MGLASNVAALVATFDLEVVRLLRDAMRPADLAAAQALKQRTLPPAAIYERRELIRRDVAIQCRQPKCPPANEASSPQARSVQKPQNMCMSHPPPPPPEMTPTDSPIQPPWKTLVWENKPAVAPVKITIIRPDIVISKGSILDLFI
jgi:hypothetical protein